MNVDFFSSKPKKKQLEVYHYYFIFYHQVELLKYSVNEKIGILFFLD